MRDQNNFKLNEVNGSSVFNTRMYKYLSTRLTVAEWNSLDRVLKTSNVQMSRIINEKSKMTVDQVIQLISFLVEKFDWIDELKPNNFLMEINHLHYFTFLEMETMNNWYEQTAMKEYYSHV
jgi:hypothetical protein